MIRKLLLGTVALAALSTTAFAADLPSRRAPPMYAPPLIPVFTWTGFYLGGQIGDAFGHDVFAFSRVPATGVALVGQGHPTGIIGGAHAGYNFSTQGLGFGGAGLFGGGLVIGIEGDIDGSDYRDALGAAPNTTTFKNDIQGSVRGRLGVAVDRALFYATGGAAFGRFVTTYSSTLGSVSPASSKIGYTVGGGVEYAITTQWSLRGEFRYTDFGTIHDAILPNLRANRRETQERAQVGFSYKFDTPVAPVVARY